jgi:hypothetical protein
MHGKLDVIQSRGNEKNGFERNTRSGVSLEVVNCERRIVFVLEGRHEELVIFGLGDVLWISIIKRNVRIF